MSAADRTIAELLASLCDETISPDEMRRLDDLICTDANVRRHYLEYLDLHARLSYQFHQPPESLVPPPIGVGFEAPGMEGGMAAPFPPIVIRPNPEIQPSIFSLNAPLGGMLFSYAVSALLVCLGMLIGWTLKVSGPELYVNKDAQTPSSTPLPFVAKMSIVGRITGMVECRFSEDRDILPPPGNNAHVPLGRKYKLNSGLMEISYDTGAKVILQGPVMFEVESASGGFLSVGRLTAKIEKKVGRREKGELLSNPKSPSPLAPLPSPLFFVRTPNALITDLGTEFGVDVDRSGLTASHVFRGKVVVTALADGGEKHGSEVVLGQNESAKVEKLAGGDGSKIMVRRTQAMPGNFVRSEQFLAKAKEAKELPMKPFRQWKAFSDELRKRDDLLAYYDFQHNPNDRRDATNSEVLRNRAATGRQYDGQLRGAVQWAPSRFPGKHALRSGFSDDDGVHVNIPVECKQLTVAAWVNLDRLTRTYTALVMSDGWGKPGNLHWQILPEGQLKWEIGGFSRQIVGFSPPVFNKDGLGKWHFVAGVCDLTAGKLAMYLDGKPLSEHELGDLPAETFVKLGSTMISAWEPLDIPLSRDRRLEGRMDELMIFRAALSPEEIRKIYEGTKE